MRLTVYLQTKTELKYGLYRPYFFLEIYRILIKNRNMRNSIKNNIIPFSSHAKKKCPNKGFALFNEGLYFFNNEIDDKALEKFLQAEKLGYVSAEMTADIACIYHTLGKDDKAREYIDKSLKIDDEFGYAHFFSGLLYNCANDTNRALKEYLRAEKLGNRQYPLFKSIAKLYNVQSNYFKALEYASKQIKYFPKDTYAYYWKGDLLFEHDEYNNALQYFLKAEKLGLTTDSEMYFKISYCYSKIGNQKSAIEYANKVIFLAKDEFKGYYRKGFAYFENGDFELAQENFILADKYNCPYSDMYSRLAYTFIYFSNPDKEKALYYANKAFTINKKEYESYYMLGAIASRFDEDDKTAVKYFRKYLKKESYPTCEAYSNLCCSLIAVHRYKEADKYLDEALKLYPDDTYLLFLKIVHANQTRDTKKLYKYSRKLYKIDNSNQVAICGLALYYYNKKPKDIKNCIKYCKKLTEDAVDKFVLLAFCYIIMKDFDKSITCMEKFILSEVKNNLLVNKNNCKELRKYCSHLKKVRPGCSLIKLFEETYPEIITP